MNDIREIYYSSEYEDYLFSLPKSVKGKYDYVEQIIRTMRVVSTKFVKRLEGTEFYEARISTSGNEYRTIIFAIDNDSFIESNRVLFLNSFLKKSTKQYKKETDKACKLLEKYKEDAI